MHTIFKYVDKTTQEPLGYHLDTWCNIGEKQYAKRYDLDTPEKIESQKQIIENNLKYILDGDGGVFRDIHNRNKKVAFKNLSFKDVEIVIEQVEEVPLTYNVRVYEGE